MITENKLLFMFIFEVFVLFFHKFDDSPVFLCGLIISKVKIEVEKQFINVVKNERRVNFHL